MKTTQQTSRGEQPGFATKQSHTIPGSILVALLGMQVTFIPWMLVTLLNWSTDDMLEGNIPLYLMLLPLFLIPFLVPLGVKLSRLPRFATFSRNWLVYIGLAVQALLDWLIYARFNGLFPFDDVTPGWFSGDNMPIALFAAWFNWSAIVVIPGLICALLGTGAGGIKVTVSHHAGLAILAGSMGMQWGGPWSMPLAHLVWVAILGAILSLVQDRRPSGAQPAERQYYPVFSTAGVTFLACFWSSVTTITSGGAPSQAWPWLACSITSVLLLLLSIKRPGWIESVRSRHCIIVAWMTLCGATIAMILVNLFSWVAQMLVSWQLLGFTFLSFAPVVFARGSKVGTTRTGGRLAFAGLMAILGIIVPYLLNIYDPVSSYMAFIIVGLPIVMSFTALGGNVTNSRDN